jgi:hypothetical protein
MVRLGRPAWPDTTLAVRHGHDQLQELEENQNCAGGGACKTACQGPARAKGCGGSGSGSGVNVICKGRKRKCELVGDDMGGKPVRLMA